MSCDVAHSPTLLLLHLCHSSFSNPSLASPTSQDFHLRQLASRPSDRRKGYNRWIKYQNVIERKRDGKRKVKITEEHQALIVQYVEENPKTSFYYVGKHKEFVKRVLL